MTEILEAMTRPDVNGTPSLPKRTGPKGLLLAINPASVSHISSVWSKQLGLDEFVEDWVFNLEKDIG